MGGITTWEHAIEYLLVGSTTLQVCTIVMFEGFDVVQDLNHGLKTYMHEHGLISLHEIIGKALPSLTSHEKLPRQPKMVSSIDGELCLHCGKCHVACRDGAYYAISFGDDRKPVVDEEKCDGCSLCTHVCPIWGCITMKEVNETISKENSKLKILRKRIGE
jgi:dihydropyrimidine dehydrogenase (NAD+) subunit PreA